MRYVVYGVDAVSQAACAPLTLEAESEDEARVRAVARGMAVRAVIEEQASPREPAPTNDKADSATGDATFHTANGATQVPRGVAVVLLPLALAFLLILAIVRTAFQAAIWTCLWGLGALLGGGLAGLLAWASRGTITAETAWPIGLALGLTTTSALHGARAGWRWWWARQTLTQWAQAFGVPSQENGDDAPTPMRLPVLLAQGLAGAIAGTAGAVFGWASGWSAWTIIVFAAAGALALGTEGAILSAVLARRRPLPPPGAETAPSFASLAWLLARSGIVPHAAHNAIVSSAVDRAGPGAVAGAFVGLFAVLLARLAVGT